MSRRGEPERIGRTGASPNLAEPTGVRFDRSTHPDPVARARAWRSATSVSMETEFGAGDLEDFVGSIRVCPVGSYLLADLSLAGATVVRQRSTRIKWEHDHVILDLTAAGRIQGRIGGKAVILRAGDCAMVDLRGGMRLRMDDARFVGLIIPRALFIRQAGATVAVDGLVFGGATNEGKVLGSLLALLVTQVDHLSEPASIALAQAIVDVLIACVSPLGRRRANASRGSRPVKMPTLAQLRRFIDRYAMQPDFDTKTLCARFGLSRTALYRMFAPAGGVAEAIRQRRAAIAIRLLTPPGASAARMADIARASGFNTERSLRNALRELYAASPREIIRGGGVDAVIKAEPLNREIERLFDEL